MDDEQTKKAFIEGEKRVNELAKQLMNCRSQIFSRDRNSRMSDITVGQLQKMETPTTYESVGKMFVHVDQEGLKKKMTDQAAKDRREIAILEKTKSYLESSIADQEKNLKEMLEKRHEQ